MFPPCTPYGVQKLLEHEKIELDGRNVVVVGASNIVGKPMALMLMQQDATVCICHKKTRDLAQFTMLADILVVAAGVPGLIIPQMVRTGAVVIDVGINRLPDGRIVGDVDFEGVRKKASFISPGARRRRADDARHAVAQHADVGGKDRHETFTRRRCNAGIRAPRLNNLTARQRCGANKNMHLRHFPGWHSACFTPGIAALSLSLSGDPMECVLLH